ncbi:MAG: GNAT family N-acetyltransferase [Candidatus Lokiarchaeota archaeon]|nr:GNAT family N-acetyltransferase [Candidatus Lokiarchaeota archaeon]MBD3200050.1 GNAT family N-acetyltransferase [Candidatus Lokiarchaeota archaeon]
MSEPNKEKDEGEKKDKLVVPFLKGENVDLLPINLDHLNLYTKWFNLEEMRRYSRMEFPQTKEQIKKNFSTDDKGGKQGVTLEIWHKKDKKPIGLAGLNHINWFNRNANIFLTIEPNYQQRKIGTQVGKMLVDYGFLELNLEKIHSSIIEANEGSWKTAEKIGFSLEVELKDEAFVDGKYYSEKKYGIFREEWLSSKKN